MNNIRDRDTKSNVSDNKNWYSEFAEKLIAGNFLLTALEFHAELIESGKELPRLKEFFSNPGNFENLASNKPEVTSPVGLPRSSSQVTLDSLDLTRYSEDGERSNDDRVAVLEFELRKARETIGALRANLTVATVAETETKEKSQEKSKDVQDVHKIQKSTIKPHEQRALNFLINEYLLLHGYKLTSITFSDENESQDFDDWDDVGLNIGRPVELLSLYREGLKASGCSNIVQTSNFECQVALNDDIEKNLNNKVNQLEEEITNLKNKIALINSEYSKRLQSLENQETMELESHISLSPDPEYFEIIDGLKSREESETKSDKSNGDWTKIGSKFKKELGELRFDNQSNYESISINEKDQSSLFENLTDLGEDVCEGRKNDSCDDKLDMSVLEDIKLSDSSPKAMTDSASVGLEIENQRKEDCNDKSSVKTDKSDTFLTSNPRNLSDKFSNEFLLNCDMNIPTNCSDQVLAEWLCQRDPSYLTVNQVIDILSESIPKIVPNIILNKREEITPLLILSICLNPSSSVRDKLLNLLFNLKKKPQEEERQVILSALANIARVMGPGAVENEVLPQCWEQITHKYVERRMLVAESCFILAPHVSETIRNSLVVSIAKQLLQDREQSVRKSTVNILALLVVLTSDEEKYTQILDIGLQLLNDESSNILNSTKCILFPVLAQWSFTLKRCQSDLFKKLLHKLEEEKSYITLNVIEALLPFLIMTLADSENLKNVTQNVPAPGKRQEFCKLCKGLCDPVVFYNGSVGKVMGIYDFYTSNPEFETSTWPEIEWIWNTFIPVLLKTGEAAWNDLSFLLELISCFRYLCLGLGKNVVKYKIKPILLKKIQECENSVVAGQECQYMVIPLYLVGVLSMSTEDQQEMDVMLRKFICILPICGVSLMPLKVAIELLSRYQPWQLLVLDGIWEGVAYHRPLVRCAAARLFQSVINNIPENVISSKVLPALVTLSNDPEVSVRTASIPTLGMLTKCKDKTIKDKVYMSLQSVLQDSFNKSNTAMVLQFAKTMGNIYENCDQHFREEVIVPQLYSIAAHTLQYKLIELIQVLTEVYATVSFSQSHLSYHCIMGALLPGLRCLESVCSQLNLQFTDQIDSMIKQAERRGIASRETLLRATLPSPSEPRKIISNTVSTQVVVEDVKSRVTKMFHSKPSTLQNVSGIFKKKS